MQRNPRQTLISAPSFPGTAAGSPVVMYSTSALLKGQREQHPPGTDQAGLEAGCSPQQSGQALPAHQIAPCRMGSWRSFAILTGLRLPSPWSAAAHGAGSTAQDIQLRCSGACWRCTARSGVKHGILRLPSAQGSVSPALHGEFGKLLPLQACQHCESFTSISC